MIPFRYNLRSLVVRRASTIAATFGIALVILVLASVSMLAAGIRRTAEQAGNPGIAVVLGQGADAEGLSTLAERGLPDIFNAPGVARDERGQPIGVGETVVLITLNRQDREGVANVTLRGVTDDSKKLRPTLRVIQGREPASSHEALLGRRIVGRYQGAVLGGQVRLDRTASLEVVGVFEDRGSSYESEIWAPRETIREAFGFKRILSSVRVAMQDDSSFEQFRAAIEGNGVFHMRTLREPEFYHLQSDGSSMFLQITGVAASLIFALAAIIGAMITMYASAARRSREIGTLRALGFTRREILIAFVLESAVIGLLGAVIGVGLAMCTQLFQVTFLNFGSFSEMVFSFELTPSIAIASVVTATLMGAVGGFLPAMRAARTIPAEAMRR